MPPLNAPPWPNIQAPHSPRTHPLTTTHPHSSHTPPPGPLPHPPTGLQDLKREDFTLKTAVDERNALYDGRAALRAPHALPTLDAAAHAHEADDDGLRVVPIDIAKFKESIAKKAARQAKKMANMVRGGSQVSLMSSNSVASIGERTNSRLSVHDGGGEGRKRGHKDGKRKK